MATGLTPIYLIPYPLSTDPVNVHGDMRLMALQFEDAMLTKVDKNLANTLTKTNTYNLSGTDNGIIINQAGTGVPLKITNTGTGVSFLVEDSASTDSTPFVIDASGNVGIGKTTPTVLLDVAGVGAFSSALTALTFNALSLTSAAIGFTIAGGTISKTLTISNTLTLSGTDSSTLNIGNGGTLGSAAFTASTEYILSTLMTTLGDTIYGGVSGASTRLAGNITTTRSFLGQTGDGTNSAAPSWTSSVGSGNIVLATSPTLTTPIIDSLQASSISSTTTTDLYNNVTTGYVRIGSGVTSGRINFAESTTFSGQVNIAADSTSSHTVNISSGAGSSGQTKTINIGTGQTAGTFNLNIGSSSATGTTTHNGTFVNNIFYSTGSTTPLSIGSNLGLANLFLANSSGFNGNVNIANSTQSAHTVAISNGAGTANKTINVGTSSTAGITAVTIGSNSGATSNITLHGTVNATTVNLINPLAIAYGGTGNTTAPTQYGVIYAGSTTAYASTTAGTSGQVLKANTGGAPTWVDPNELPFISVASEVPEIIPLDNISGEFNGIDSRFMPKYQGIAQNITNPLRLVLSINGIIQYVDFPDYVWQSPLPKEGFQIDNDGYIAFSEVVPAGSSFDARIMPGPNVITKKRQYPFKAVDILLGG